MKCEWGYDTLEQTPLLGSAISISLLPLRSASPTQGLDFTFGSRMKKAWSRTTGDLWWTLIVWSYLQCCSHWLLQHKYLKLTDIFPRADFSSFCPKCISWAIQLYQWPHCGIIIHYLSSGLPTIRAHVILTRFPPCFAQGMCTGKGHAASKCGTLACRLFPAENNKA